MRSVRVTLLAGIALAVCLVRPVKADSGTATPGATGRTDPAAVPAHVKSVELWPGGGGDHQFGLDDQLIVNVESSSPFLKSRVQCSQLILFLDDLPVEGLAPKLCNLTTGKIVFHLVRGDATTAIAWSALLRGAEPNKKVDVSVGLKGSDPIETRAHDVTFRTYRPKALGYLPGLVLLIVLACLAWSGLLRDSVPDTPIQQRPYSLSRCQLAGWLLLIMGSYFLVWVSTGEIPTITQQLLALLGVTAGTAVGGLAITSAQNDRRSSATQVAKAIGAPAPQAPQHGNFLFDILSEGGALSVIRLQHAVWTLVLWVLFVLSVYRTFGLLDFDKTLLGLMGISALAYGTGKFGEDTKKP